jgi:hypothetical protein
LEWWGWVRGLRERVMNWRAVDGEVGRDMSTGEALMKIFE